MRLIITLLITILMLTIVMLFMVKMIFDYVTHAKIEPQINYKKWETPPKFEHKGDITTCVSVPACLLEIEDELHIDC